MSIYQWRAIFEELGNVIRPPLPLKGRTCIISRAILTAIYNIYKGDPDLYLDKLQFWLAVYHNNVISISSLQQNLEEAGLSRKLLHKIAKEHNEAQRQEYWDVVNGELRGDGDLFVMADETSKNELSLSQRYGRAVVGDEQHTVICLFVETDICLLQQFAKRAILRQR